MITLDKFIQNIDRVQKQGTKLLRKEILDLFEPIVFQYVLYTRIDTGSARKAIGYAFAREVKSQRIIDATDYDVEVSHDVYNFWNFNTDDQWNSICNVLVSNKLLSVNIIATDVGLYNQAELGHLPSENHETRLDNTPDRMPPHHINVVNDVISGSNLESITNANIAPYIANDIKQRVQAIVKKIETELFKP